MLLLLIVISLGAAWGVATGGILELARRPPRLLWLFAIAALLGAWAVRGGGVAIWLTGSLALMAFAAANLRRLGMPLVLVGALSNVLVVLLNGAMPVSAAAAEALGRDSRMISSDGLHEATTDRTGLTFLGDTIAVPMAGQVLSIGDVLLATGGAVFVISATRSRP